MGTRKPLSLSAALSILGVLAMAGSTHATLIAHFAADGTADDSAGTNDGTLVGGTGFRPGQIGQAFDFSGAGQYVSAPDSALWAFGTNDFTIAAWVNFDAINQGPLALAPNVFVGHDTGPGTTNKWAIIYDGLGTLSFHVNGPAQLFLNAPTSIAPVVGDWNHYAITRTGNNFEYYFNGASLGIVSNSVSIPDAAAPLTLGQIEGLGFYDGALDDVRIYDNALSSAEVAALAAGVAVPEPGPAALLGLVMLPLIAYRTASRLRRSSRTSR